jgi:TolB-like protein/Flp pilus assembly protein TadD
MSFLAELKRRNVIRVAVFYLVSGWLVLQMADVMFGVLRLPDWTLPFVAALLALGFVPTVVLSWVYEFTPDGIKKESEINRDTSITPQTGKRLDRLIIVGLVAVIGILVVERFWSGDSGEEIAEAQTASQPSGNVEPLPEADSAAVDLSVAVLPFANMSSDEENEYFADGLTEELLNALAQIESLKVAGRTSSFYFKGRNEDLKSIGRQLGVGHVLEGSVRKAGERVRITAQLIKVDDGFHLWSDTFDRDLADIFQVQEEISRAIANAMKLELGLASGSADSLTENLQAYEMYLEAKARISTRSGLGRAIGVLERATELDPGFAEAWAALGQAYALGPYYGLGSFEASRPLVEKATDRALALKLDLSSALTARADMYRDANQWQQAESLYRAALSNDPDEVEANSQYAQFLGRAGYFTEALPYARRAREFDPLAGIQNIIYGWNLALLGRYEEADPVILRALELDPDNAFINMVRFRQLWLMERLADAEPSLVGRLKSQEASEE